MTPARFWWWSGFWIVGWTLWLFGPRDFKWLGFMMGVLVAPWFAITRNQFGREVTRGQIVLLACLVVILVLAVAIPSWFHVRWSMDSWSARLVCLVVLVLGVVVNARRTFRGLNGHAA
jgi:uncharacterized membrane protein